MSLRGGLNKGFTLIELLVVIAIIGILASVVLASLNSARVKARNAAHVSQLREYQKSFEMYFANHGVYPPQGAATWGCLGTGYPRSQTCWSTSAYNESNSAPLRAAIAPYMSGEAIPGSLKHSYYHGAMYRVLNGGRNYQIIYILEGTDQTCPIGNFNVNYSGSVTRCDYTHPL